MGILFSFSVSSIACFSFGVISVPVFSMYLPSSSISGFTITFSFMRNFISRDVHSFVSLFFDINISKILYSFFVILFCFNNFCASSWNSARLVVVIR